VGREVEHSVGSEEGKMFDKLTRLFAQEDFGMNVTLTIDWSRIDARIRMERTVLHNVTEVHLGYPPRRQRIAFESDIHSTGCTYDTSQIVEMEVRPATHKAKAF